MNKGLIEGRNKSCWVGNNLLNYGNAQDIQAQRSRKENKQKSFIKMAISRNYAESSTDETLSGI